MPFRPDVVVGAAAGSYAEVVYPGDQQQPAVTDDVKDCWEPAHVEPGIPPILTMPGVLLATELVSRCPWHCVWDNQITFCEL